MPTKHDYNDEFRITTVMMAIEGKTVAEVCKKQGIVPKTFYAWRDKFTPQAMTRLQAQREAASTTTTTSIKTMPPLSERQQKELENLNERLLALINSKGPDLVMIGMQSRLEKTISNLRMEMAILDANPDIKKSMAIDLSYHPLRDSVKLLQELTTKLSMLVLDLNPGKFNTLLSV